MRFLHRLIGLILVGSSLAFLVTALYLVFSGYESWVDILQSLKDLRKASAMVLSLFSAGLAVYLITGFRALKNPDYLAYETDSGTISISIRALRDYLARLKQEEASVVSLKPDVKAYQHGLDITIDVRVRAGSQIPEVAARIQERARALIRDQVGISEIHDVQVRVQEILDKPGSPKKPIEVKAEPFNQENEDGLEQDR